MQTGRRRETVPAIGVFKTCPLRTAALQTLLSRHGLSDANYSTWKAETRLRAGLKAPVLDWKYGGKSNLNSVSRMAGAVAAQLRDRRVDKTPLRPPRASAAPSRPKGSSSGDGGGQGASSRLLRSRRVLLRPDDAAASTGGGPINSTQDEPPAPAAAAAAAAAPPSHHKSLRQRAKKSALGFGLVAMPSLASDEALNRRRCRRQPGTELPVHHNGAGGGDPGAGRAKLSARKRAAPVPALLTKAVKSIRGPHHHQHQTTTDDNDAKAAPPHSSNAADGTATTRVGLPLSRSSSFSIINGGAARSGSSNVALVRAGDGLLPVDKDEQQPHPDDDDDDGDDGEEAHGEAAHLAALLMAAAEVINSQEREIEGLYALLEKQEKTLRLVDAELLSRTC